MINSSFKCKQSGLTLLEVMVALLIFALTGTAVLKAASDHLQGVGQLEDITFATWVANNRLNQLQYSTTWPPKNNQKGSEEMAGREWHWQQKVIKAQDKNLRAVEVSVSSDDNHEYPVTSVLSYIAKPVNQ